jgi:hypothetical protein
VHEALAKLNFDRDAALLTPRFLKSRNWTVNTLQFPTVDVTFNGSKPIRISLQCDNWDELPPLEKILNADGSDWTGPTTPESIFNAGPHETSRRPFICMRGFRGYHTHGGHASDLWSNYRNQDGNNLPGLLNQLSSAWRRMMGY